MPWSYMIIYLDFKQSIFNLKLHLMHYLYIQVWQGAGWILSSSSCLAVLFATYSWSRGQSAKPAESVVYAIFHRTIWAAGVAWVLFTCATGHGGNISTLILCITIHLLQCQ